MQIGLGETIGLIGETGSGKSTLADILMGLLRPSSGQILVDGKNLYDSDCPTRIVSWTKSIAHVPQDIYLADASFAENIAFGVKKSDIDMQKVIFLQQSKLKYPVLYRLNRKVGILLLVNVVYV